MNVEFRLPTLTADTPQGQVRQLYSFLRQTVEQLNWALRQLPQPAAQTAPAANVPESSLPETFGTIKALILKSADIATAYYEKTKTLLQESGEFVAQSQFGTYQETMEQQVEAQVDAIRQAFSRVETITDSVCDSIRTQQSFLRFGLVGTSLDQAAATTAPGIEIGDYLTLEQASQVTLRQRFARFTAYGLELFGSDNQTPVAYISDRQLHIGIAQAEQLMMGQFITAARADGTTVKRWVKKEVT